MGEPGQRKEELLHKVARYARERGMSLLAVDLLGVGTGPEFDQIVGRSDLETTLGHIMDYLVEREDVDAIVTDGTLTGHAREIEVILPRGLTKP